jgi:hypothetical protein
MSEISQRAATTLERTDCNDRDRRPAEVHERIVETDFCRILSVAQNALDEFAWAVDSATGGTEIVGLAIVGSFLTDDFEPHQSDLDVYLLANQECEHGEAFCRMLLDSQCAYRQQLLDAVPRTVTYVDPLDLVVRGAHHNVVRQPSVTLKMPSTAD